MPESYLRVHATYRGRLGVEVGVFGAVDHLRRAGVLTEAEQATYLDVDDWFVEHLPNPDFYADGNTIGAVTWFREPVPAPMREHVEQLCAILRAHGVPFEVARSTDPGTLVYTDDLQVGVVPYTRGEPTPLPDGLVQTPTTAGSKRAVAASPVRHVVLAVEPHGADGADGADPLLAMVGALQRNGYGVHRVDPEGVAPAHVLVVGSVPATVDAARARGMLAVSWSPDDGVPALVEQLAQHGVNGTPTVQHAG